jgi:phosphoglycerate dehydrogenase-like enzyme
MMASTVTKQKVLGISEPLDFSPAQQREIDAIVSEYNLILREAKTPSSGGTPTSVREEWIAFVNDCDYVISGKQGLSAKLINEEEEIAGTEGIYHVTKRVQRDDNEGTRSELVISHPFVNVAWVNKAQITNLGITLLYAPGCNCNAVSEWVLHSTLSLFRQLHTCTNKRTLEPKVHRSRSLVNKNAVILGKGAVGSRCGEVLSAMKMNVKYLTRNSGISINELVQDADLVINCLNSTSTNTNILNTDFFNKYMSKGSIFISMTNPIIYDIDGLLTSISNNHIHGAAIDIGNTYPGDVTQINYAKFITFLNTFPQYENVLLVTPQLAHYADVSQSTSFDMAIENIRHAVEDTLHCIPERVWNN